MKVRKVSTKILALGVWTYLRLFSEKGGFPGGMFVRKRVVFMLRRAQSCGKRRQPLRPGISLGGKGRWGAPPSPVIIIMILWYTYLDIPRSLCTRTQGYEIGNNACMWLTLSSVELWGRRYMGSTTTYIWLECGKGSRTNHVELTVMRLRIHCRFWKKSLVTILQTRCYSKTITSSHFPTHLLFMQWSFLEQSYTFA